MASPQRSIGLLRIIAIFKFFKALVLLASLATVFNLVRQDDPAHTLISWALKFHVDRDNRYLSAGLAALLHLNPKELALLTVGTGLYAVLFFVEGVGLWAARLWAEYLTIIATAGFIPVELYEIHRSNSAPKMVTFALNIAIVAYLVVQVRRRGHSADIP
ncbi:MAG TPA: DUF2127 domain-containing protein [Candidatus Acidoferrales bacterium]|nr:DUF2127 domain-containing protein [Candidatus Acidoferrales bacterium]